MDDINALLGMGLEDEEELRALADSLRGRKRAADFFAATTVIPLREAANREQASIAEAAAQGGVLKKALEERRQREEEKRLDRELQVSEGALDRASYEKRAGMGPLGMTRHMGLTRGRNSEGDQVMMGYNPQTGQMEIIPGPEGASIQSPMSEVAEANARSNLGERLKGVASLEQQFNEVDAAMSPYLEAGIPPEKIPGLGFFEKNPLTGPLVRGVQDIIEPEGSPHAQMNQAVLSLMNTIVRNSAGLTQTVGEVGRINAETGMDVMTDPQAFAGAYERIRRAFEADLRRIKSTTDPRIWAEMAAEEGMEGLGYYPQEGKTLDYPESSQSAVETLGLTGDQTLMQSRSLEDMSDEEAILEARKRGWSQ